MQKIIKVDKKIIVIFEDGSCLEKEDNSGTLFDKIVEAKSDEDVYALMSPKYIEEVKKYNAAIEVCDNVKDSMLLTMKENSVYWEDVSQLSMPTELVKAVLNAEFNHDEVKIDTYRNFWTLMSLNTDSECRENLFWFLNRNSLSLSRQGFFVAYRNVVPNGKDEDGSEIFTDYHSHTTRIKIGEVVSIPRKDCDCDSRHECSRGLICSPVY